VKTIVRRGKGKWRGAGNGLAGKGGKERDADWLILNGDVGKRHILKGKGGKIGGGSACVTKKKRGIVCCSAPNAKSSLTRGREGSTYVKRVWLHWSVSGKKERPHGKEIGLKRSREEKRDCSLQGMKEGEKKKKGCV